MKTTNKQTTSKAGQSSTPAAVTTNANSTKKELDNVNSSDEDIEMSDNEAIQLDQDVTLPKSKSFSCNFSSYSVLNNLR